MTLLVRDQPFYGHILLQRDIVIKSEAADLYYRWSKLRGGMDFIGDFMRPGTEHGPWLDLARTTTGTIVTDRIVHRLIAGIRALAV